jgi:MFS family permease
MYGRQVVFAISYGAFTAFNAATTGSKNIQTLLVLRFFAGSFGSSPLTNAGGQIADIFNASERGLAMGLFALAPFLGPTIGPIAGGFLGQSKGWKWVEGLMTIFSGVMWLLGLIFVPETYAPVLLRKRAKKLSSMTGKVYRTKTDAGGRMSSGRTLKIALVRPWILLFKEPIVLVLSIYMAIIYGTLYMLFGAFPICFQEVRGWSEGIDGLSFLGVASE